MKLFKIIKLIPQLLLLYIAIKYVLPNRSKVKSISKNKIRSFFKKLKLSPKKQVV